MLEDKTWDEQKRNDFYWVTPFHSVKSCLNWLCNDMKKGVTCHDNWAEFLIEVWHQYEQEFDAPAWLLQHALAPGDIISF